MVIRFIMRDDSKESHPLLAQIPLTVSPFISLPTATTLSYTYKTLPSTLPQSSTRGTASVTDEKAKYVVSASGHAAHPSDIIVSCKSLQTYLQKVRDDADRDLNEWEEGIKARELAEKRRVAPGWLDSDARLLEPQRRDDHKVNQKEIPEAQGNIMDADALSSEAPVLRDRNGEGEGEELDKVFGRFGLS